MTRVVTDVEREIRALSRNDQVRVLRFFYFALACQTVMQVLLLHFFATHMR